MAPSTSFMAKAATFAALSMVANAHPHHLATRSNPGDAVPYHQEPAQSWKPDPNAPASLTGTPMTVADFPAHASAWLASNFNHTDGVMANGFQDAHSGVYHYYSAQKVDGLQIINAAADVHLDQYGNPIMASNAFAPVSKLTRRDQAAAATTPITASQAVDSYAKAFGYATPSGLVETVNADGSTTVTGATFAQSAIKGTIALYHTADGSLEKVWSLSVQTADAWHNAFISVADGSLVGKANWQTANFWNPPTTAKTAVRRRDQAVETAVDHVEMIKNLGRVYGRAATTAATTAIPDTSYRALPFSTGQNLDSTPPVLVTNPFDPTTSPLGWHDLGDGNGPLATTAGNNAISQENHANLDNPLQNSRPISENFVFDFAADDKTQQPTAYVNASITNIFFLANKFHDTLYKYGFDEASGNFQVNNNGKGGVGQDPVLTNAQDGSGTDNANFATPPDGQPGIMRMFVFTSTNPERDGALENNVPIHELGHGVSSRLTGGAATANCLQTLQSGGMGEGWSDFFGLTFTSTPDMTNLTDRPIGTYVTNTAVGVRPFPYSTNIKTNPLTYETLNSADFQEVHQIGTVWNSMLFESYWNVVNANGFTDDFSDTTSGKGNVLMTQYIVDSFKLQPCNPTLVQSRDAIIAAEKTVTNGANACNLWAGFAKRGLGAKATSATPFVNDFSLPAACVGVPVGVPGTAATTGTSTVTAATTGATGATETTTGNTGATASTATTGAESPSVTTGSSTPSTATTGAAAAETTEAASTAATTDATGATAAATADTTGDGEGQANPDDAPGDFE
ncbi:Fungalysin/Thermolysin Extracellular metalloproteinase 5 [Thoreauomyces humboldtii]|nr:Fungalysin/Thermolysin Extracellular metalloproteinase 5 [Thoreauomyces humboldtii]